LAASCEKKSIGISLNEYTGSISSVAGKTVTVALFEVRRQFGCFCVTLNNRF